MLIKVVRVNGSSYKFTLTDPIISQVNRLRTLYDSAYVDPEGFEQISAEIAEVVSDISQAVEPRASDSDLDGVIQEIILTVDKHEAERDNQLSRRRR